MGKGPGFFDSIGKRTKDLLYKDYTYDHKITVTTTTLSGVTFVTNGVKKGDAFLADLKTQFEPFKGAKTEVQVDSKNKINIKTTYEDLAPGLKATLSGSIPDNKSGKFEFEYGHEFAGIKGAVGLTASPIGELSAAFGQQGFSVGGDFAYDTSDGQILKYNAGVGYTSYDFTLAGLLQDKGDTLRVSYLHTVDPLTEVGVEVTHKLSEQKTTFTTGAQYRLDPLTITKARLNNHGMLAALVQHEWRPKSTITISGEVDTKALDKSAKVGLALALKP